MKANGYERSDSDAMRRYKIRNPDALLKGKKKTEIKKHSLGHYKSQHVGTQRHVEQTVLGDEDVAEVWNIQTPTLADRPPASRKRKRADKGNVTRKDHATDVAATSAPPVEAP